MVKLAKLSEPHVCLIGPSVRAPLGLSWPRCRPHAGQGRPGCQGPQLGPGVKAPRVSSWPRLSGRYVGKVGPGVKDPGCWGPTWVKLAQVVRALCGGQDCPGVTAPRGSSLPRLSRLHLCLTDAI